MNFFTALHRTLAGGLELCGLLVDYCSFYKLSELSFWRHPFTAEDPLLSKWNEQFIYQNWSKLIYILNGLRVSIFPQIFIFGAKHYFKFSLEEKLLVNADFNFVLFLIQSYCMTYCIYSCIHFYTIWFLPPILRGIQALVYTDTVCYLCKLHWNYTVLLAIYTIINYITCQTKN